MNEEPRGGVGQELERLGWTLAHEVGVPPATDAMRRATLARRAIVALDDKRGPARPRTPPTSLITRRRAAIAGCSLCVLGLVGAAVGLHAGSSAIPVGAGQALAQSDGLGGPSDSDLAALIVPGLDGTWQAPFSLASSTGHGANPRPVVNRTTPVGARRSAIASTAARSNHAALRRRYQGSLHRSGANISRNGSGTSTDSKGSGDGSGSGVSTPLSQAELAELCAFESQYPNLDPVFWLPMVCPPMAPNQPPVANGPLPDTQQMAAQNDAQAKAQADAQGKAFSDAQAQADAQAKAQAEAERKAQAQADAQTKAQADAQAKADAQAQAQADAQAKADAQAQAQADAQAKADAQAQAQAQADAQAKAQAEAERKAQAQADAQARAEEKAQAKQDAKSGGKDKQPNGGGK